MSYKEINDYLHNEFPAVKGWCIPQLWNAIEPILDYHRNIDLNKPIAEIGIYHGKFFIGLEKSVNCNLPSHAFDVFDMQEFNLDGAGNGSMEIFKSNLKLTGVSEDAVSINKVDSMRLDERALQQYDVASGQFSFFSVDGCHTPEHTINDMKTAISLTCPEGIIFIDDYNNPSWPGVQEGVSKFYFNEYSKFVPLLFTCNKLFLCHISYHAIYLSAIRQHLSDHYQNTLVKEVKRFGYDTLTVVPDFNSKSYLVNVTSDSSEKAA